MPSLRCRSLFLMLLLVAGQVWADGPIDNNPDVVRPVPKPGISVSLADLQELANGTAKLGELLAPLRDHPLYADVAIFHRAVRVALEDHEFFAPNEIDLAKKLLATGMERAGQLKNGETPWLKQKGLVVRGYISRIDHTPQPYGLIIPESYDFSAPPPSQKPPTGPEKSKRHRLDVWFHGRGEVLSEVNFISQRMTSVGPISPADTIVLHPYGRYCNANKFAGEIDAFEAIASAHQTYRINPEMIASRGFSMGGAACWQFAVHYPSYWFAATPGAGFSETPEFLKFFQKETLNAPWWEEKLWRWYDCPGYVENLRNLPVVAYSGENDIQKQAADLMEAAYAKVGMKLPHIIAPKTGHSITPEAAKEIDGMLSEWSAQPRQPFTKDRVDFVTYSLMYPQFSHGRILGLQEHWEEAKLTAERNDQRQVSVTTKNITAFHFVSNWDRTPQSVTNEITVNGKALKFLPDAHAGFAIVDGAWKAISQRELETLKSNRKNHRTCGPIDHAIMDSFIFVKPTGKCAHPNVQKWVDAEMNRAIAQWRRQFRGDVRVKLDTEVTLDDLEGRDDGRSRQGETASHLILWGDRQSNALIEKMIDKLPIRWNASNITVHENQFDASNHALIAIYPNPQNPMKYIVLNSGFTYREYDYLNNARQTAKLPDWAVVDLRTPPNARWPGKIVAADFFDEEWKLKPARKP